MTATRSLVFGALLLLGAGTAYADKYSDTVQLFKNAGSSAAFFSHCYGYAVFPTIGEGGFIAGGAHGTGRVYVGGKYAGDASMTQLSLGFQAGGKAYSEIVFFEDKRALDEFESGSFEFAAGASAIAAPSPQNSPARGKKARWVVKTRMIPGKAYQQSFRPKVPANNAISAFCTPQKPVHPGQPLISAGIAPFIWTPQPPGTAYKPQRSGIWSGLKP